MPEYGADSDAGDGRDDLLGQFGGLCLDAFAAEQHERRGDRLRGNRRGSGPDCSEPALAPAP